MYISLGFVAVPQFPCTGRDLGGGEYGCDVWMCCLVFDPVHSAVTSFLAGQGRR